MKPTLYLTQFSVKRPTFCGVGPRYGIVAMPGQWGRADGTVPLLQPQQGVEQTLLCAALRARRERPGCDTPEAHVYRQALETRWTEQGARGLVAPGTLSVVGWEDATPRPLEDGATLCCFCSLAEAEAGRCHRTWAAPFLVRAGWRVVLDGIEVTTNTEEVNLER